MRKPRSSKRGDILRLLKRRPGRTVEEMAEAVGITPAAVRKHLGSLEQAGLIDSVLERRPMGRPASRYRLTDASDDLFPNRYEDLARSLLNYIEHTGGPAGLEAFFEDRNSRILDELMPLMVGKTLEERVSEVSRVADEKGSMPGMRLVDGHVALEEHHCVMGRISRDFPQACQYEEKLLRVLLGVPIRRVANMASGDDCCSYIISPDELAAT